MTAPRQASPARAGHLDIVVLILAVAAIVTAEIAWAVFDRLQAVGAGSLAEVLGW